ncbi:MAG: cellobiose phosphorylase, partial [Candidatus Omnitrophota bacterium]|nr:cellobiose phosphorylase [Candidatus Omnitrophota bacterium]
MDSDYLLRDDGSFVIKNYNSKPPFSNFLPGVAGAWGVPIWVFYVNRAQGVISFGIKDKDHSITEFFPANNAYCFAGLVGFRTFLKIGDKINYEPFRVISDYEREEEMVVKSASFEIRKTNANLGLNFCVKYFTLPNTIVGALVRELSIKNISDKEVDLEVLDGLPKIIPFGLNHVLLKDLARTLEAWMRSYIYDNLAIFRLIVDPKDSSQTKYVDGATFNCSFYHDNGKKVSPYLIVDPGVIFAEDTSYSTPVNFFKKHFRPPLNQITFGKTPCTFSHFKWNLKPGQEKKFYSIFGSCFKSDLIKEFVHNLDENFLKEKAKENEDIIDEIKNHALCVSASGPLNHYIGCTYLDNVLRGGYPYSAKGGSAPGGKFNGKDIYYIFSRKHGDLERDYNKFKLLPSYFSEGESNYRDINQNRRMDLFFNPVIANKNIIYFLNFIKIDGYNPLVVKGERLFFGKKEASAILKEFSINDKKVLSLMLTGFHLGDFFELLKEEGIVIAKREELAKRLVDRALREPMATHGEGYWIDHWRYNLDLIESFLYFYPDKAGELFLSNDYCFWDDEYRVKERKRRYHLKDSKVYQWHSVEEVQAKRLLLGKRGRFANFLRDKKGNIYRTHLVEKILALILNKAASLDPQGIGIEMEADKPGWCDSLNGLPALFGSSLCETLELKRACLMLTEAIKRLQAKGIVKVKVAQEVFWFLNSLNNLLKAHLADNKKDKDFLWWDKSNSIKEKFRKQTFFCLAGKQKELNCQIIEKFLENLTAKLNLAIAKAKDKATGLYFAYFSYNLANYSVKNKYVVASRFVKRALPHFLEGAVHSLRVEGNGNLYQPLKESSLFDAKLKMYRLNASLSDEPLEIGRSRIFVPGWLENESIWLHMEYKYLLEVLKKGLYEEFFKDFYNCAVCFLEPRTYGRNILENSSFIVSSAYPDKSLWAKGFVARLSGATAELLNIWVMLCLG